LSLGEIYVAFFNLNSEKATICANIVDLTIVYPARRKYGLCIGTETWSRTSIKTNDTLSAEVASHGSALFVLHCQ